jgi:hypothetical protein
MKKLIEFLFPKKTNWVDVSPFEVSGVYYLLQMRTTIKTNRKEFRRAKMGFINDHSEKQTIYKNVLMDILLYEPLK